MLKTIDGVDYVEEARGVLIPAALVEKSRSRIRAPEDLLPALEIFRFEEQEHFLVCTLDGNHQLIRVHVVTKGLADRSQVHPRETYRPALFDNAISIMVAHNHPSGSLEASVNDLLTTRRLAEAGRLLRIPLVDHLILSREGFISLRERFPDYFEGKAGE